MIEAQPVAPNLWSFLQTATQVLGTAFAVYIGYRQMRRGQDPKLDRIEVLVNGNLTKAKEDVAKLEAQLRAEGFKPVTEL